MKIAMRTYFFSWFIYFFIHENRYVDLVIFMDDIFFNFIYLIDLLIFTNLH